MLRGSQPRGASIGLAVVVTLLAVDAAAAAAPVLGSPDYVANGGGFGTSAPSALSNGGAPSGVMTGITWRGWGRSTAYGTGRLPIYRPQGNYYPPVLVRLKASRLGTCPGRSERAYTTLVIRYPQWPGGPLGSWRKWSSSRTICDYADTDPAYEYPRRGPGVCDEVGEYGEPDTVQSIHVYRLSCASARRAARRLTARERPFSRVKRGCTRRTGRLRCRLGRVRAGETTGYDYPYPVQRLSCRRGAATLSAFLVLSYD